MTNTKNKVLLLLAHNKYVIDHYAIIIKSIDGKVRKQTLRYSYPFGHIEKHRIVSSPCSRIKGKVPLLFLLLPGLYLQLKNEVQNE